MGRPTSEPEDARGVLDAVHGASRRVLSSADRGPDLPQGCRVPAKRVGRVVDVVGGTAKPTGQPANVTAEFAGCSRVPPHAVGRGREPARAGTQVVGVVVDAPRGGVECGWIAWKCHATTVARRTRPARVPAAICG